MVDKLTANEKEAKDKVPTKSEENVPPSEDERKQLLALQELIRRRLGETAAAL